MKVQFETELARNLASIPRLRAALPATESELIAVEQRVDWLETQIYLIKEVGIDHYLENYAT
jgi:bacterioferritin (cytochrome b1)